ncbi:MAG: penicillin-binding protein 2 [Vulcanimicrobiota bacterium]
MNKDITNRRLTILLIVVFVCCLLLIGRLFQLQLLKGEQYTKSANTNVIKTTFLPGPRGEIRDRYGKILAFDVPRLNICMVISEIKDENEFARTLGPLIGYSPEIIKRKIEKNRQDIYGKIIIKPRVDTETMMKVAEQQGDLPGLYLDVQPVREYPFGDTASHVIGYVSEITKEELDANKKEGYLARDFIGKDGIEKYYDGILRGRHGAKEELTDVSGHVIKEIGETKPSPGKNIYLSLDIELQKKVEEILKWNVNSLSAISGQKLAASAIVMDIKTGEILAMASIPQFDPNKFLKGMTEKEYQTLINRKDYPLLNRNIAGTYPLASTFKMVTGIAALQEGLCTRYSPFNCNGYYEVGSRKFYCFVRTGHGKIDFNEAISESCDVVFYELGEKMGIEKLLEYSRNFGLGQKTRIDLPSESPGLLPDNYWKIKNFNEPWYTGDTVNLSIGQGFLGATPLQLAVITATVANDGRMMQPHLLIKTENSEKKQVETIKPTVVRELNVDKKHFDAIKDGMRSAVKTGTAKLLDSRISSAGKTGTAENFPNPENPYGRNHTWFAGFAPSHDPEIAIVVFFEKSGGYGGKKAVPMAREILDDYARLKRQRAYHQKQ